MTMWKESYRTGVERIDFQHKMLFDKSQQLLDAIERGESTYTYQEIINFLKGYVVFHFRDEEKYQQSIEYEDYESHRMAHEAFTDVVLDYERRLIETDFDQKVVSDLAGMLTTWLIYHVANTDLRMVQGRSAVGCSDTAERTNVQLVTDAVADTLGSIAGLERIRQIDAVAAPIDSGMEVSIGVFGDVNGTLSYTYSDEVAGNLFQRMTALPAEEHGEMVRSALAEIANISSGNATIRFAHKGMNCDIRPPKISHRRRSAGVDGVVMDTGIGRLLVSAKLDRY